MIGTVSNVGFGYAFILCIKGRIFCHASQMPPDDVGRRYLLPGEKVSFELGSHNGRTVATNVTLETPHESIEIDSYYEEGAVQSVRNRGELAFVMRPFGGVAMLHYQNVKACQSRTQYGIKFFPGQQWRYSIAPPIDGDESRAWLAVNAVEIPPV